MRKVNLQTKYLGLTLSNPIIVSSSGLTSTLEKVKECEAAGAGAVVLKSIFEEQISSEAGSLESYSDYPEAADYLKGYIAQNAVAEYLKLIEDASAECKIPIIASINCSTKGNWVEYARQIERAGASALELNIFLMPTDSEMLSEQIERHYLEIVESVKSVINMPLAVKLPQGLTSPLSMIRELYYRGVKGVTLFNRFYSPDIDIEKMKVINSSVFSTSADLSQALRWTALSSVSVPLVDVAISTGVHSGEAAIKGLLAGAKAIEVCSVLYANGVEYIQTIVATMEQWCARHDADTVEQFSGRLNAAKRKDATIYERAQFMKYFSSPTEH